MTTFFESAAGDVRLFCCDVRERLKKPQGHYRRVRATEGQRALEMEER